MLNHMYYLILTIGVFIVLIRIYRQQQHKLKYSE